MTMWVMRKQKDRDEWAVGHYEPVHGDFIVASTHGQHETAARRVNYLNGGAEYDYDIGGSLN